MDKMKFKNAEAEKGWREWFALNSTDMYSLSVCYFAALWAYLMEQRIEKGEKVADIAKETGREADTNMGIWGVTGFQYGLAVGALSQWWKWGEELRQWHNLDTQIGTEGEEANEKGGVLNPAILNIGPKE